MNLVHAKSPQSYLILCDPMDCSLPGSSVHGILQAGILEWTARPSSRGSSWPRDGTWVSCLLHWQAGSLLVPHGCCLVIKSSLTICNPMDCSTPGFPVLHCLLGLLKIMSIESVMPSNLLILCCPLLPPIFPSIRVLSKELALCIRWPKYWSFSFSISPSNEHSRLIKVWSLCSTRDSHELRSTYLESDHLGVGFYMEC